MNNQNILEKILGKTIAIVYAFEGEKAPGFKHYHIWKSDVISEWLKAVQNLKGRPFILDVRTFVEKAMSNTLPHIDYVINLNCGSCELSPMGLVPSICGFLGISCIPCDTTSIIVGENKLISNFIAEANGLNVPPNLSYDDKKGIYRPLNFGSSYGVKKVTYIDSSKNGIYQKFINGYDITTPFIYNPVTQNMDPLPTIIYLSHNDDKEWFFDEKAKINKSGYERAIIAKLQQELVIKFQKLIESLSIKTFCRIDARIQCKTNEKIENIKDYELRENNTYFIEINPMPTIKEGNSFGFSYNAISKEYPIYPFIELLKNELDVDSMYCLLLASSILSYSNSKATS